MDMTNQFSEIPESFWGLFRSRNRQIYIDALLQVNEEYQYSKYYLSRQFKQFTGLSLYQYIMKKRLISARNMLRAGSPVMDACLCCGFGDYSNFLKAFKREFAQNPSKYSRG